jgi:hypothetical protein
VAYFLAWRESAGELCAFGVVYLKETTCNAAMDTLLALKEEALAKLQVEK